MTRTQVIQAHAKISVEMENVYYAYARFLKPGVRDNSRSRVR